MANKAFVFHISLYLNELVTLHFGELLALLKAGNREVPIYA